MIVQHKTLDIYDGSPISCDSCCADLVPISKCDWSLYFANQGFDMNFDLDTQVYFVKKDSDDFGFPVCKDCKVDYE